MRVKNWKSYLDILNGADYLIEIFENSPVEGNPINQSDINTIQQGLEEAAAILKQRNAMLGKAKALTHKAHLLMGYGMSLDKIPETSVRRLLISLRDLVKSHVKGDLLKLPLYGFEVLHAKRGGSDNEDNDGTPDDDDPIGIDEEGVGR